jgi:hypothetical protein
MAISLRTAPRSEVAGHRERRARRRYRTSAKPLNFILSQLPTSFRRTLELRLSSWYEAAAPVGQTGSCGFAAVGLQRGTPQRQPCEDGASGWPTDRVSVSRRGRPPYLARGSQRWGRGRRWVSAKYQVKDQPKACGRFVLTNRLGHVLAARLGRSPDPRVFRILSYRIITETDGAANGKQPTGSERNTKVP